jgi:N-acetylglucosaminyldiphosphoundecaprenol N-acetyl-beta-D-mannosaminyltransferase
LLVAKSIGRAITVPYFAAIFVKGCSDRSSINAHIVRGPRPDETKNVARLAADAGTGVQGVVTMAAQAADIGAKRGIQGAAAHEAARVTPQPPLAGRPYREPLPPSIHSANPARQGGVPASPALPDDLQREVYCILGIAVDALDMAEALRRIRAAASADAPYVISTPNLNFVVASRADGEFRESVLQSDLCPADGMPIVWIARMLGLPIRRRVAGADMFAALRTARDFARPLKVFLFGGREGVAAAVADAMNRTPGGLHCVGALYPGYGAVEDMSANDMLNAINASGAEFLAVALSASKGQAWLKRNRDRLRPPVRAQLGAALNFQAGAVRRAPSVIRRLGLEWLWRIKEEPYLWRRYFDDGMSLVRLMVTRIVPLAIVARWQHARGMHDRDLMIRRSDDDETVRLSLSGAASARNVDKAAAWFRDALAARRRIVVDLSDVRAIDSRFLGLLLMLRKQAGKAERCVNLAGAAPHISRVLRLHCAEFLLSSDSAGGVG